MAENSIKLDVMNYEGSLWNMPKIQDMVTLKKALKDHVNFQDKETIKNFFVNVKIMKSSISSPIKYVIEFNGKIIGEIDELGIIEQFAKDSDIGVVINETQLELVDMSRGVELDKLSLESLISAIKRLKDDPNAEYYETAIYTLGKKLIDEPDNIDQAITVLGEDFVRDHVVLHYFISHDDFFKRFDHFYNEIEVEQVVEKGGSSKDQSGTINPNLDVKNRIQRLGAFKFAVMEIFDLSNEKLNKVLGKFFKNQEIMIEHLKTLYEFQELKKKSHNDSVTQVMDKGILGALTNILNSNTKLGKESSQGLATLGTAVLTIGALFSIIKKFGFLKTVGTLLAGEFLTYYGTKATTGNGIALHDMVGALLFGSGGGLNGLGLGGLDNTKQVVKEGGDKERRSELGPVVFLSMIIGDKTEFGSIRPYLSVDGTQLKFDINKFIASLPNDDWRKELLKDFINKSNQEQVSNLFVNGLAKIGVKGDNYDKVDSSLKFGNIIINYNKSLQDSSTKPVGLESPADQGILTQPAGLESQVKTDQPLVSGSIENKLQHSAGLDISVNKDSPTQPAGPEISVNKDNPTQPAGSDISVNNDNPTQQAGISFINTAKADQTPVSVSSESDPQLSVSSNTTLLKVELDKIPWGNFTKESLLTTFSIYSLDSGSSSDSNPHKDMHIIGPDGLRTQIDWQKIGGIDEKALENLVKHMPQYYMISVIAELMIGYYKRLADGVLVDGFDIAYNANNILEKIGVVDGKKELLSQRLIKINDKAKPVYDRFMSKLYTKPIDIKDFDIKELMGVIFPVEQELNAVPDIKNWVESNILRGTITNVEKSKEEVFRYLKETLSLYIGADMPIHMENEILNKPDFVNVKNIFNQKEFINLIESDLSENGKKEQLKKLLNGLGLKERPVKSVSDSLWDRTLHEMDKVKGYLDIDYTIDSLVNDILSQYKNIKQSVLNVQKDDATRDKILLSVTESGRTGSRDQKLERFSKEHLALAMNMAVRGLIMEYYIENHDSIRSDSFVSLYSDIIGSGLYDLSDRSVDNIVNSSLDIALMLVPLGVGATTGRIAYRFAKLGKFTKNAFVATGIEGAVTYEGYKFIDNLLRGKDLTEGMGDMKEIIRFIVYNQIIGLVGAGFGKIAGIELMRSSGIIRKTLLLKAPEILVSAGLITTTDNFIFDQNVDWTVEEFIEAMVFVGVMKSGKKIGDSAFITKTGGKISALAISTGSKTLETVSFGGNLFAKPFIEGIKGVYNAPGVASKLVNGFKLMTFGTTEIGKYKMQAFLTSVLVIGPQLKELADSGGDFSKVNFVEMAKDYAGYSAGNRLIATIYALDDFIENGALKDTINSFEGSKRNYNDGLNDVMKLFTRDFESTFGTENTDNIMLLISKLPYIGTNLKGIAESRLTNRHIIGVTK